jgi:hypothetical protein
MLRRSTTLHDKKKENKRQLKLAIENNRKKIEESDKQYSLKQSLGLPAELKGSVEVDVEHSRQVEQFSNELNKLKTELENAYCEEDSFQVWIKGAEKMLMISDQSQIFFYDLVTSDTPTTPSNMNGVIDLRMELLESNEGAPKYLLKIARTVRYIDELKLVKPVQSKASWLTTAFRRSSDASSKLGYRLEWHNKPKVDITTNETDLDEVLGAHLKRFNATKIKQVNYVKDLFTRAQTQFSHDNPEHEALLIRLWNLVYPNEICQGTVHSQWTKLGFQSNDPARDFRGMGLLALDNLIYLAEHYAPQMRHILNDTKEYPFASVGINITSMLFTLLNIKQQALLNEPYYSPAWNSPLILFFCQCSVYYHTHHKQKETTDLKYSNNTNSLNNSADLRNSPKHVNNKPLNTVNNISLSPIDLTLDEDQVIIIDEESPRAKIDSPLNNLNRSNSSANNSNASDDNEAREEKFPFEELFCYLMFLLDSLWDNMEAKYMDFPKVSANLKQRITSLLDRRPISFSQLKTWIQQEIVVLSTKE